MRAGKLVLPFSLFTLALGAGLAVGGTVEANQRKIPVNEMMFEEPSMMQGMQGEMGMMGVALAEFHMDTPALGGAKAPGVVPHAGSHGATVITDEHGVLSIDRDSGELVRSDAQGRRVSSMKFNRDAGELVRDGNSGTLYLADRRDDRVVVLRGGAELEVLGGAKLHEPHGLALSPDGKILYVTTVADHELVALDTETMAVRWRLELAAEPRGVAVSADGATALVGFLSTGAVASVELGGSSPNVSYLALDAGQRASADPFGGVPNVDPIAANVDQARVQLASGGTPAVTDSLDVGRRYARNAFAVGFIGDDLGVVPHQFSMPHMPSEGFENEGTYGGGGGFLAPITHRLAMIDGEDAFAPETAFAQIGVHQPRAMAYDGDSDTLYVAGYGDDKVLAIAEASRSTVHLAWSSFVNGKGSCAPDGLAVDDGGQLWVHCELSRSLIRFEGASAEAQAGAAPQPQFGPALAASTRSASVSRGADLFRRGMDPRMSVGGFMACASCHAEGRADGLSWRIEGHNLQTPVLAGRVVGAHPYKWDGKDKDLPTSLNNTIGRLGGGGLQPSEIADLQAFVESMPRPEAPQTEDGTALARGKAVFESDEAACVACHDGPRMADGVQHSLGTNIGDVDTPSLIGLAHSAPYYHDGSARTLRALLTDKASIHDMGQTAHLSAGEVDDLVVYLESL